MPNPTSGVLNPYALAEIVLNRRVDWANTPNALQVMADALGTPANELFDPQYKSITYAFREPAADGGLQTRTLASMAQAKKMTAADLTTKAKANPESVLQMLDIAHAASMSPATQLQLGKLINGIIFLPPDLRTWTPAGATWVQEGEFFDHGTQYSDPQQGALGDCWLISTLASIAWTRPTAIVDCNRPTGTGAQDFLNQITFCPSGTMQISEKVPMGGSSGSYYYMFARGLDGHETWPAIYEKAFAKWKSGNLTDEPPYDTLNGNSPIYACQSLLGLAGTWNNTYNQPDSTVENLIAASCTNNKSTNPMMACTWGSAADAKKYANVTIYYDARSGIVADHCYSVLGFIDIGSTQYVVLRNPWGYHEGTLDVLTSPTSWSPGPGTSSDPLVEPVPLNTQGVFAMKTTTFKQYYQGIATFAS